MPWPFDNEPTEEEVARWRREFEAARSFEDADDEMYAFRPLEQPNAQNAARVISRNPFSRVTAVQKWEEPARTAMPPRQPKQSMPQYYDPVKHDYLHPMNAARGAKPVPSATSGRISTGMQHSWSMAAEQRNSVYSFETEDDGFETELTPKKDTVQQSYQPSSSSEYDHRDASGGDGLDIPQQPEAGQRSRNGILWKASFGGNFTGGS
ncbi:hypothetical protein CBER1_09908 [Cercospora berteroae]|uniref:Uncharacterized protein n=1 Tax=Cercospora berteroae TaxID=357750 RepID=A0A2S6BXG8_9PEZI|nr:hypothetical protein CBER1_09908 [Cercospora berteroae]